MSSFVASEVPLGRTLRHQGGAQRRPLHAVVRRSVIP